MTKAPTKRVKRTNPSKSGRKTARKATQSRAVLVTTEYRGVFFGYATDTSGDTITLTNARNCIYWPAANGGFGGLASMGPVAGSRIGARVPKIELRKITSVSECSEVAVSMWEAANVHVG